MLFLKSSAISAFLAFIAAYPAVQGASMREMHEFIEHMKESEKRNGPIRMSKPSLAMFLKKSEQMNNLKGTSSAEPRVSKEELEKKLEYYHNFQAFAQDKRDRMAEEAAEENANRELNYQQYNQNRNGNYRNYGYNNGNAQNYGGNGYNNGANGYNNGGANQGNGNRWWWNNNKENIDGSNYTDAWQMYETENNSTYSLNNLGDLSLKYAGCSSVTSYVGVEDGDQESSGFMANALVQYRLCPAQTCQDNSWSGCVDEYGEYMMSLQDFLEVQVQFKEEQFNSLCEYCKECEEYNQGNYCDEGQKCCSHTDDCEQYQQACEGHDDNNQEAQEYQYPELDYESIFQCMEVELDEDSRRKLNWYNGGNQYNNQNRNGGNSWWGWGGNNNGYNNYNAYNGQGEEEEEENSNVAYLGIHCNGQNMQLGLFSDNSCTHLIGTEENGGLNVTDLTGLNYDTAELEAYFVPQGCLACGGEEYNVKSQWWYIEQDKYEDKEEDYIYQVCNNMYESSAKCNANLGDDIKEKLYESDAQVQGEQLTCDFIKDAILGEIDENGFVSSHVQEQAQQSTWGRFWKFMTDPGAQDPTYTGSWMQGQGANNYGQTQNMQGRYEVPSGQNASVQRNIRNHRRVTPAQKFMLSMSIIGSVAMGAAAFFLQKEYEAATPDGLMRNENAESSLPYDNGPASRPTPVQTPSRARLVD